MVTLRLLGICSHSSELLPVGLRDNAGLSVKKLPCRVTQTHINRDYNRDPNIKAIKGCS